MTEENLTKLPPQNIEAEQSVLGALLIDEEAIIKVSDLITGDDFYKENHQLIFEAMFDLFAKREPIDILSLTNILKEKNQLEKIGGQAYLASLAGQVPTASNIVTYANIIQKKATLRKLITAAGYIAELGFQETEGVDELLDKAEKKLFNISHKYLKQNFIPLKSVLTEAFDRIDELHKEGGKFRGLPTEFNALDNILAGLQNSDLIILASRPSIGKTSLALDIAKNIAIHSKKPVGIFSLEMSKEQIVDRLLCSQASVDLWKMRTGRLSDKEDDDDFPRIGHAMGQLSEAPMFIDDSATANIMEIRTKARRLKLEHDLSFMVVDYLQLMESRTRSENRVQEVAEITRGLKSIARELNIPVLALSQLSRGVEARSPSIPRLSDLRESGSIEQDADVVMFIYREFMDKSRDCPNERKNVAEIHIAKHRNGPTGQIDLYFDERTVSFKNLEKSVEPTGEFEDPFNT